MECERVVFSGHAVQRMFQRGISHGAVLAVLAEGEVIAEYADDTPYPSRLLLGFVEGKPIHVVAAVEGSTGACVVVTAYEPSDQQWGTDFRTRRQQ